MQGRICLRFGHVIRKAHVELPITTTTDSPVQGSVYWVKFHWTLNKQVTSCVCGTRECFQIVKNKTERQLRTKNVWSPLRTKRKNFGTIGFCLHLLWPRKILTVWSSIAFGPSGRSWMTRGGLTFTLKPESSVWTERLNSGTGECKCADMQPGPAAAAALCAPSCWSEGGTDRRGRKKGWATRQMMDERFHR